MCIAASCRKTVRALFAHIHSLHVETFDEIIASVDDLAFDRKGKAVLDVDALIANVLHRWHNGRLALREQVAALFLSADVNSDGVLSFDEFTACV